MDDQWKTISKLYFKLMYDAETEVNSDYIILLEAELAVMLEYFKEDE